jgi:alkane 1-monooxygenase
MRTLIQKARFQSTFATLKYLLALSPPTLAIAGNLFGGVYSLLDVIFPLVFLVALDWISPRDYRQTEHESDALPNAILYGSVSFHTLAVVSLIYGVHTGILQGQWVWYAATGTGFSSGILGITAAHELIHRKEKYFQAMGIWNLFISNYTHFFIEHRFGHHPRVGTLEDAATARYGESFYAYAFRAIPQQWFSALHLEGSRLRRMNRMPFGLENFIVRATLAQVALLAVLCFALSPLVMAVYLTQAAVGFFLLEYVNYIEHYGLVRKNGEKVDVHHAWQSDTLASRFTLFELSRHADHHFKAHKPYHTLVSHPESPALPSGYFGMFYVALVPPVWFAIVHPIIERYQQNRAGVEN